MKQTVAIAGACLLCACTFLRVCEFVIPPKQLEVTIQQVNQPVEFRYNPQQEVTIYSDVSTVTNTEFSLVFDFKYPFPEFDNSFIEVENCAPYEWITSDDQRFTVKFIPYGSKRSIVTVFGRPYEQNLRRRPLTVFSVGLDLMGPKIVSIDRPSRSGITTSADEVEFIVRFNEPVERVSSSDFAISEDWGAATGRIQDVIAGSNPKTYRVIVSNLSGDRQRLTIDVHKDNNIRDFAGNSFTGEVENEEYYVVDVIPPTLDVPERLEYLERSNQSLSLGDFQHAHWGIHLTNGKDGRLFELTATGELSFKVPPEFNYPLDRDKNNLYELEVAYTDGVNKTIYPVQVRVRPADAAMADYLSSREED